IDDNNNLAKIPAVEIQFLILAQQRAVDYAYKKGAVIVTSAGNDATNFDGGGSWFKLPAGLAKVITVSATAPDYWYRDLVNGIIPNLDIPASYTDYGKSFVEVAAPGGDFDFYPNQNYHWDMVLSTYPQGYVWMAGTSMAAPHVSGVAALIIGKNGGQMRPIDVITRLEKTADKIDGKGISPYYGFGRVNAYRAVQ
ncbi:MAG: S8 family serine peptidase, partial [Bacteroidales bacterium]|nr:S8 family serine peptidase [Bacteroidales bacterium]